jgi:hypothetical protein
MSNQAKEDRWTLTDLSDARKALTVVQGSLENASGELSEKAQPHLDALWDLIGVEGTR